MNLPEGLDWVIDPLSHPVGSGVATRMMLHRSASRGSSAGHPLAGKDSGRLPIWESQLPLNLS